MQGGFKVDLWKTLKFGIYDIQLWIIISHPPIISAECPYMARRCGSLVSLALW